ncbi:MAG: molybdopterin molybdotransferase MoeA [Gemmataceae bacterium]|nr:molybdopterin molybdotransferase MoeA [Gemmataceae bacterium]
MIDVRMRGFRDRAEVAAVERLIDDRLQPLPAESIALTMAAGRVLAGDVIAAVAVPGFDRAAMDGYAVRGHETFGADPYSPLEFAIVGQALPGRPFAGAVGAVGAGQAVRIMTGAPLPDGADAVVQAEAAAEVEGGAKVRITEPVPPGRHVGKRGEDIEPGSPLLPAGRRLRPQDLGVLASVGASPVAVRRQPSVAIVVTGDELLACGSKPAGFRIVDSNSVMLAALAARDGAAATRVHMVPDRYDAVRQALQDAAEDVILVSGGSSVGQEDHAPRVLRELGELCIHGVALRPASPTGLGFLGPRPVFLLPGNPVSCLCAYDLFGGRAVRRLGGRPAALPYPTQVLPLARKIASLAGRVDYVRVRIAGGQVEPLAISGASILSSTTRADGFVIVPAELEGYPEGASVLVYLYDG